MDAYDEILAESEKRKDELHDRLEALPKLPSGSRHRRGGRAPRFKPGEHYTLVPMTWALRASQLAGAALKVGMFLWYRAGYLDQTEVPLSLKALSKLTKTDRQTLKRGLKALETAGLLIVKWPRKGSNKSPLIQLLDAPRRGRIDFDGEGLILHLEAAPVGAPKAESFEVQQITFGGGPPAITTPESSSAQTSQAPAPLKADDGGREPLR